MTRRHFRAMALAIAQIEDPTARETATHAAVRECSRGGSRFDADRFRSYIDSERSKVVSERVIVCARASRAA